jgi:biopolymer transport protein ExbB
MGPLPRSRDGRDGGRYVWLSLILVTAASVFQLGWDSARGQEPAAKPEPAPAPAKAEPAPAAEPADETEAAKSQTTAAAADATPPKPESMLMWAIRASGFIGLFLLCLSVYFTALVIRLFMEFRVGEAVPPNLVDRLETAIKDKKFQEAYDSCKDSDSYLARLVRTGIAGLPNGKPEAKEQMQAMSDEIVSAMEMKISYLAIIGTLGPMIGLVGTIWGMILSFQEIATAAGAQPRPEKVAEGISTALFITLEGVSLAVPAIFFFAFFRNRIAQIALEANKVADRTINSLMAAAKSTKPA